MLSEKLLSEELRKSRLRWYDAWYFSRLNVCAAAAALTASASQVLVGSIEPGAVLFVALGTYVVYAMDDLLDWRSDEERFPVIRSLRRVRLVSSACMIPAAVVALGHLVADRGIVAPWPLVSQAFVSMAFCTATARWPHLERGRYWSTIRAVLVSLVWASVCALTPLWWAGQPFSFRAARAVLFLWQLMFVVVLLWQDGETAANAASGQSSFAADTAGRRRLTAICACSALLACLGVLLGHFPRANLSVTSASVVNLLAIQWWTQTGLDGRVRNDLLVAANNACCALVVFVHAASSG